MEVSNKRDFDPSKLLKVDITTVQPNSWNPKEKDTDDYRKVKKSVELKGLRAPVAVRELKKGQYEIIDGEQRYTSAKELGYKEIYIYNEGVLDDDEAQSMTLWYQQQVPFDEVTLAPLVAQLDDVGKQLPFDEAKIQEYKAMANFSFDDYKDEEFNDDGVKTLNLKMNAEAYNIVMKAINKVKDQADCNEARAIELICADYLGG